MKKTVLLLTIVATALLMTGCSDPKGDEAEGQGPKKQQASHKQEKTVVVVKNEGMSAKEEKKLQQRLDALEKKVDDKSQKETENQGASHSE